MLYRLRNDHAVQCRAVALPDNITVNNIIANESADTRSPTREHDRGRRTLANIWVVVVIFWNVLASSQTV